MRNYVNIHKDRKTVYSQSYHYSKICWNRWKCLLGYEFRWGHFQGYRDKYQRNPLALGKHHGKPTPRQLFRLESIRLSFLHSQMELEKIGSRITNHSVCLICMLINKCKDIFHTQWFLITRDENYVIMKVFIEDAKRGNMCRFVE